MHSFSFITYAPGIYYVPGIILCLGDGGVDRMHLVPDLREHIVHPPLPQVRICRALHKLVPEPQQAHPAHSCSLFLYAMTTAEIPSRLYFLLLLFTWLSLFLLHPHRPFLQYPILFLQSTCPRLYNYLLIYLYSCVSSDRKP